jgi:hypothetical protein
MKIHKITPAVGNERGDFHRDLEVKDYVVLIRRQDT